MKGLFHQGLAASLEPSWFAIITALSAKITGNSSVFPLTETSGCLYNSSAGTPAKMIPPIVAESLFCYFILHNDEKNKQILSACQ